MATAADVLRYIKSRLTPEVEAQLHTLVYYAQAWTLTWDGVPLFPQCVEAWRRGPVTPAICHRTDPGDPSALTPVERANVDAVMEYYCRLPGAQLSELTRAEPVWSDAWARRKPDARGNEQVTHDAMREFYTREALEGRSPQRRPLHLVADEEEVQQVAAANAERWHETLAALAQ